MIKSIAFDFGHGETVSAYTSKIMKEGKPDYEVKRLVFDKSRPTVYSRIFITEKQLQMLSDMKQITYKKMCELDSFIIGNFSKQTKTPGESFAYFKVQPSRFDDRIIQGEYSQKYCITHRMVMSCFIYQAVKEVLNNNPNDIMGYNNSNTTLLIGCPTSEEWTSPSNAAAYKELIINATGVKNVVIIPESRAAMFSSITYSKSSVAADKGAVIFDFGSSTADCTYMWMGKKAFEFSWQLGASAIETALWNYLVSEYNKHQPEERRITTKQNIISSVECTKVLRSGKEEFFASGNDIETSLIIEETEDRPKIPIIATIDDESINEVIHNSPISFKDIDEQIIKNGSWYELCRSFFETAKERISNCKSVDGENCPISSIVLTGGASKMPFVQELCREVFPQATIYLESNPSYSVSNGLCWVQISDDNMIYCQERIFEKIKEAPECKIDNLLHMTSEALVDPLIEIIGKKAEKWSESDTDSSIEELIKSVSEYTNTPNVKNLFKALVSEQEHAWEKQCSRVIKDAIKAEAENLYSNNVPDYIANFSEAVFNKIQLNFDEVINELCSSLVKLIQDIVIQLIIYIIGILLCSTGVGAIVGLPLIYYADTIADKIPVISNEITKVRGKSFRKRIANNINNSKKDNIAAKLYDSIKADSEKNDFINDDKLQEKIKQNIEHALEVLLLKKFN